MSRSEIRVVADNVRSLENVGSLFRTGDAFGVSEILSVGISGYPDAGASDTRRPYLRMKQQQALSKTALSGIHLPFRYFATPEECIDYLRSINSTIFVIEQHPDSVPLVSLQQLPEKSCIVVGNEITGVSHQFIHAADTIIEIPMLGKGISLNVSVTAGIVMHFFRHLL